MADLPIDEIANRIIDAILSDNILTREKLKERIRPILKIWVKRADGVKKYRGKNTPKAKLQEHINQKEIELEFWKKKLREVVGGSNMHPLYDEITDLLKAGGYLH